MTASFIRSVFLILLLVFTYGCKRKRSNIYTYDKRGYHYKLLAFESDEQTKDPESLYKVSLAFRNQKDSVFWDSYNNFQDFFILNPDSVSGKKMLNRALDQFNVGDSGSLLIRTGIFFKQQFNFDKVPYFSAQDSVVKINFKIGGYISPEGLVNIQNNLTMREKNKINDFFGSALLAEENHDPLGFYWQERPEENKGEFAKVGDRVILSYEGSFLNGRFLEKSPDNFEMILGTPDQLLKGINFVIQRLKIGQTAKIILPSHLAFGDEGSTNGTVPPYTPLAYKVKIIDIQH